MSRIDALIYIGIPGIVLLVVFFVFILPWLMRAYIKSTGEHTKAVLLETRMRRGAMYSDGEHNQSLVAQNMTLKLEVHPRGGAPYIAEDHFMVKAIDLMRLTPGCEFQVAVARGNPKRVVCLPETITASANAPTQARANLAMANLIENASHGGSMSPQDVVNALHAQGVQTASMSQQDDPKAKLEKLKEMLSSGLITQQEYETKKVEILAKM